MHMPAGADEKDSGIIRAVSGAKLNEKQDRQNRKQRERDCQLVMVGVLLADKSSREQIGRGDCLDSRIGLLVDQISDSRVREVGDWLLNQLGVSIRDGEKAHESVLRTVKENNQRESLSRVLETLAMQSRNPMMDDAEFIEMVKSKIRDA